ncbi:MAG: hypothetical protein U0M72_07195 [Eggerthellaceae bacterium]
MAEELTEQELNAAKMVLEYADIEPSDTNVRRYLSWDILSFTEDAKGHYCWYMDEEGNEVCIHVETLEEIETSEFD